MQHHFTAFIIAVFMLLFSYCALFFLLYSQWLYAVLFIFMIVAAVLLYVKKFFKYFDRNGNSVLNNEEKDS